MILLPWMAGDLCDRPKAESSKGRLGCEAADRASQDEPAPDFKAAQEADPGKLAAAPATDENWGDFESSTFTSSEQTGHISFVNPSVRPSVRLSAC